MTGPADPTPPAPTEGPEAVIEASGASDVLERQSNGENRAPSPQSDAMQPTVDEVRNTLWQQGWTQGSILPDELRKEVRRIPFAPDIEDDEIAIVVTQGCDAIHGDCAAEPALEVVLARPIPKSNPNMKVLKNPRLLHVDILRPDGTRQPIEVSVWRRGFIDRRLLLERQPSMQWKLPADSLDLIVLLFGRRYDRVAFPEAFVERFRPVATRLEKHIERLAADVTGVYLRIDPEDADYPEDEDPALHPYDVQMYFMMSDALTKNDALQGKIYSELKNDLQPLVNKTPGLKARPLVLVHPFRMTIGEFRDLTEWDHEPLRQGLASKNAPTKGGAGGSLATSVTNANTTLEAPRNVPPTSNPLD